MHTYQNLTPDQVSSIAFLISDASELVYENGSLTVPGELKNEVDGILANPGYEQEGQDAIDEEEALDGTTDLASITSTLQDLNAQVSSLTAIAQNLQASIASHGIRLASAESSIQTNDNDIDNIVSTVNAVNSLATSANAKATANEAAIQSNDADISGLIASVSALEARVAVNEADIDALEAKNQTFSFSFTEWAQRRQQTKMASLTEDHRLNMSSGFSESNGDVTFGTGDTGVWDLVCNASFNRNGSPIGIILFRNGSEYRRMSVDGHSRTGKASVSLPIQITVAANDVFSIEIIHEGGNWENVTGEFSGSRQN